MTSLSLRPFMENILQETLILECISLLLFLGSLIDWRFFFGYRITKWCHFCVIETLKTILVYQSWFLKTFSGDSVAERTQPILSIKLFEWICKFLKSHFCLHEGEVKLCWYYCVLALLHFSPFLYNSRSFADRLESRKARARIGGERWGAKYDELCKSWKIFTSLMMTWDGSQNPRFFSKHYLNEHLFKLFVVTAILEI